MDPLWLAWGLTAVVALAAVGVLLWRLSRLSRHLQDSSGSLRAEITETLLREFGQNQEKVGESLRTGREEQS